MSSSSGSNLVTVATYWDPMQAQIARLRLAHAGIPAFLEKEFVVQTAWIYTNAVDGVRMVVPAARHQEAIRLLTIKEPYSDWKESRCWEPTIDGKRVVVEDDDVAAVRDREFNQPLSTREELAERGFRAAFLGLGWEIPFLFACGILWKYYNVEGPCRPAYRHRADIAWRVTAFTFGVYLTLFLLAWMALASWDYVPYNLYRDQREFSPPINTMRP